MCGKCCNEVTLIIDRNRTDIEWLELHNLKVKEDGNDIRVTIKLSCSKQIDNKCSIYESRPEICKNFRCEKNVLDDYPDLKL
jgi:Fe-S-cluster containining protein